MKFTDFISFTTTKITFSLFDNKSNLLEKDINSGTKGLYDKYNNTLIFYIDKDEKTGRLQVYITK